MHPSARGGPIRSVSLALIWWILGEANEALKAAWTYRLARARIDQSSDVRATSTSSGVWDQSRPFPDVCLGWGRRRFEVRSLQLRDF